MPFIRKIEARAYARATEILERVETAIYNIFPEEIRQTISIRTSSAEGQAGNSIDIVAGLLETKGHCEETFDFILREIGTQGRKAIERSIDLRLDDNCVFFLRIDKQAAFLGELKITDNVDVISIQFHFKEYPRCKRIDAIQMIENRILIAGEK